MGQQAKGNVSGDKFYIIYFICWLVGIMLLGIGVGIVNNAFTTNKKEKNLLELVGENKIELVVGDVYSFRYQVETPMIVDETTCYLLTNIRNNDSIIVKGNLNVNDFNGISTNIVYIHLEKSDRLNTNKVFEIIPYEEVMKLLGE